ncbi:hypothetical protein OIN60_01460 [Paenibacillus sp. P96]|uniref:DUF1292 domain-containing protein n=1 Tax=Paenibacillus zeirhizosphaerae TaxID=2987519 RepID=A0ABT9FL49_9BACL|nr:hypothetical protein [Paenibacillus sp. P96]MDP4095459.1 hypothetical protein [Paenibacillus sp. P96]
MKGYAYLDNTNLEVLHVVADEDTAQSFTGSDGKYEEVDFIYENGYPVVDGDQLVVYGDGTEKEKRPVPQYLLDLVKRLK